VDLLFLPLLWQDLVASLASCLHQRHAFRLGVLLGGALFAKGRRTVTSWLRASGVGLGFAAYYYFLAALARRVDLLAGLLLRHALRHVAPDGPLLFALDDTPTQRYGPHVQGAGVHHNPTPGPTDQRFLYGHVWVCLAWVAHHPLWGAIALPLRALLYVRRQDVPRLPPRQGWAFRTKLELAAELVGWAADWARFLGGPGSRSSAGCARTPPCAPCRSGRRRVSGGGVGQRRTGPAASVWPSAPDSGAAGK
jgi:hypothetical protein